MIYCLLMALLTTAGQADARLGAVSSEQVLHLTANGARPAVDRRYVSFPGVGIRLMRPAGFTEAERFHGFQQGETHSSVMLVRVPGPFSEVSGGFNAAQLTTRGMDLHSTQRVKIGGLSGVLLKVTQPAYGITFDKWILAFGDRSQTFLITASFPQSHSDELSPALKAAVLTARLERATPADPDSDALFSVTPAARLKRSHTLGKMLAFTRNGATTAKPPTDPLFVAGPSLGKAPSGDKGAFAMQRLLQTARVKVSSVSSHQPIRIDGLNGYESLAEARHSPSGTSLVAYQVILFDAGGYYLMQGLVGAQQRGEYLPEFQSMARSFRRRTRR